MKKLAVLFNTITKLKNYDFEALLKKDKLDFIAIVEEWEVNDVKNQFNGVFKKVIAKNEVKAKLTSFLSFYRKEDIRFICTSEDNMIFTAELREYFDIIGIKFETAILLRDKVKMKQRLNENGVLVPKFGELTSFKNFAEIKKELGLPFVLKPRSDFSSKDVSIIHNEDDFNLAKKNENFECESFINGTLYHIDGIYNNGNIIFEACNQYSCPNADFKLGKPLLTITLPQNSEIKQKASILAKNVITALGYKTGATHLEFFITPNNEFIFLEIGGRTPGGVAIDMYKKEFELNLLNLDLLNHFNLIGDFDYNLKTYCFSGIIPHKKGVVKALNKPDMLSQCNIDFIVKKGDVLESSQSLRDIGAKIIAYNQSFDDLYKDFKEKQNFDFIEFEKE
jgi:D-alanine-D-alanine ligase-like ATP-grasp enzyme